jgi:hypothetical protein
MNLRTIFLYNLKLTFNIPVCSAYISRCLVALRKMEIPPLLCCLLDVSLSLYLPFLVVRVTSRLTIYRESVRLGDKPLEIHDQNFYFQTEHLHVTSSLVSSDGPRSVA